MGQKLTEKKKVQDKFFHVTIAYLKEKIRFYKNSSLEIRKTYFLAPKWGADL